MAIAVFRWSVMIVLIVGTLDIEPTFGLAVYHFTSSGDLIVNQVFEQVRASLKDAAAIQSARCAQVSFYFKARRTGLSKWS